MVYKLVNPHHEDILVIRSIENNHFAFPRRAKMGAPQEIMSGLKLAGLLESEDERSLRVHSAKNVSNTPALTRRVQRLQYDEEGLITVGVKQVLQLVHALDVLFDLGLRPLMTLVFTRVRCINLR